MFTGIIQSIGEVRQVDRCGGDLSLLIDSGTIGITAIRVGDSVAVNGVCLTAVKVTSQGVRLDVSAETLSKTLFENAAVGDRLNLELALMPTSRLGGHFVTGHVDGIGQVIERQPEGRSLRFGFRAPEALVKYIAPKGSIAVDGVSLTVNTVEGSRFDVNIVPHSLEQTIIGSYSVNQRLHLEVDLIARYLESLNRGPGKTPTEEAPITTDYLARQGFVAPDLD